MFLQPNYNSKNMNNQRKQKNINNSKSVDKMITSKKLNISIMDKKLSLLNSDIEDLYKKYMEKKKIRRKKEKSEKNLVSHINFLIDEERKIRTQIENKSLKSNKIKKKSIKIFNSPDIITDTGTIRYKTIESNEDSPRYGKNRIKNISRKNEKIKNKNKYNTLNNESKGQNDSSIKDVNSNNINCNNNITLSSYNSIQNNNSIDNMRNNNSNNTNSNHKQDINIIPKSNVTNNVCIIINNPEKNASIENLSHKNDFCEISFAKKENTNNSLFNITNSEKNNYGSDLNISTSENEKRKIKHEIKNIKLKLSSKIKEKENILMQNSQTYEPNNEFIYDKYNYENINTPSFKKRSQESKRKFNKNGVQSLKNILKMKRKYLSNLNKEIDLKAININIRKKTVENRHINLLNKKRNEKKNITKRSYSKPDNIIIKEINNIQNKQEDKKNDIDSNEQLLYDVFYNRNNNTNDNNISIENNNKESLWNNKPKIKIEKINNDYNTNIVPLSSITFNQSIENKRKMLGIGLNRKEEKLKYNSNKKIKDNNKNKLNKENLIKDKNKEDKTEDKISYDKSSHTSFSNITNPLENNTIKLYINNNNNAQNNYSLASIFSSISHRTTIPQKNNKNNKITNIRKIHQEKPLIQNNNNSKLIKIKSSNDEVIIKKQEKNKVYINSLRIIKKREKNNNINDNDAKNNEPVNNVYSIKSLININKNNNNDINNNSNKNSNKKESVKNNSDKKQKSYENEITVQKGLAAIRRINMKIEEYKNSKPQIHLISQRRKNRFEEDNKINNDNSNNSINNSANTSINSINNKSVNKGKNYRFKSYRRLSEIQKQSNSPSIKKNINRPKTRSKSYKSMNRFQNNIKIFK